MSWVEAAEPLCTRGTPTSAIDTIIEARPRRIDGFTVGRVLPSAARRLVGPFIFFDHVGPVRFAPGGASSTRSARRPR